MFTQLKDRFAEKLRNLGPQDEKDKQIQYLVDLGTQESLQGPNWVANMELVDVVNQSPEIACEKVLRILNRSLAKPVVRTQVLVLTMLDTCVRNCYPVFHAHLAQSVLWADLLKLVQDRSVNRIDLEVRDKILSMVEDYGKYLKHPPVFTEAYENLVDQGIDFPVRASNEVVPIEVVIPPPPPPGSTDPNNLTGLPMSAPATGGVATAGAATATGTGIFSNFFNTFGTVAANGAAPPGGSPPVSGVVTGGVPGTTPTRPNARRGGVDPAVLEGLSPEDKAAVEAAMAEMALELESAQEAAAIAASLQTAAQEGGGAGAGAIPQLPTSTPASAVQSPGATGLVPLPVPAPGVGAPLARAPSTPALPDDPTEALLVISNSVGLLTDLLGSIPDSDPSGVRDPLVRDLAEQCGGYRSRLTQMAEGITDEELLISALNQNDALTTVMARYDALLAQALSVGPNPASPADDTAARLAAAASAISQGDALTSAAPNFTLLDEDEEDGPGLTTTRNQDAAAIPAAPQAPVATDDLADLLGDAVQPGTTTTAPEHTQSATATAVPKLPPSEPLI